MGCDIHQYAEYRKDGQWLAEKATEYTSTPAGEESPDGYVEDYDDHHMPTSGDRSRNYGLFGLLSEGVRYDTEHAFAQKDMPNDVSKEVKAVIEQWDGDGHSHNHLTFRELKEKLASFILLSDQDAQEYRSILGNWIQSFGPNPEGVSDEDRRVVFFFDN